MYVNRATSTPQETISALLLHRRERWIELAARCHASNPRRSREYSREELARVIDGFLAAAPGEEERQLEGLVLQLIADGGDISGILYTSAACVLCVAVEVLGAL